MVEALKAANGGEPIRRMLAMMSQELIAAEAAFPSVFTDGST
ncbi:unannotated protein [freshwater metagenome]|uniref:Unannotated protein n=1 Tax=freshwater metagenome TaxID=449393 RepID=A0A6J7Q8Z9_9ZZZZ